MAKVNALPGTTSNLPGARLTDNVNLKRRMATMRKSYVAWSCFNITLLMIQCLVPFRYFEQIQWALVYITSLSGFAHVLFGLWALRIPGRISAGAFAVIVFAGWTVITTMSVNADLGRSFGNVWGWHILWLFHYLVQYFSIDLGARVSSFVRKYVYAVILVSYLISGIIGYLQVFGVGFAMALSSSGIFGAVFRPTGLSNYSFELGNQATIGMILLGSRLVNRNLKLWEWIGIGFFATVVLIAQYRTCYASGILFVGGALLLLQIRRNPPVGIAASFASIFLVALPFLLFPQRMGYALRGFSIDDPTIKARQLAWDQIAPIMQIRPWTGIGPDSNLMISTAYRYIDSYTWLVIDNFYFTTLACFGIIGCALFGLVIVTITGGLFMKLSHPAPGVKEGATIGLLLFGSLLLVSLTGNSFVYPSVGFPVLMLLAVGNPNLDEGNSLPVLTTLNRFLSKIDPRNLIRAVK